MVVCDMAHFRLGNLMTTADVMSMTSAVCQKSLCVTGMPVTILMMLLEMTGVRTVKVPAPQQVPVVMTFLVVTSYYGRVTSALLWALGDSVPGWINKMFGASVVRESLTKKAVPL